MAQSANIVLPPSLSILSKCGINMTESVDYKKFRIFCTKLFGENEVKQYESRVREIFKLFDVNKDDVLHNKELHRFYEWIHAIINPVNVLLVIDVQNDFIDGTLALRNFGSKQDGVEVVKPINSLLKHGYWDKVIFSQDWHPEDHISFFENLEMRELHPESKVTKEMAKPFDTVVFARPHVTQTLWPKHCVMNTWGAELHKDLLIDPPSGQIYERLHKGQHVEKEAYSAFAEKDVEGSSVLEKMLSFKKATHLYITGLAYDVCVKETTLDALQLGYPIAVVEDCCRGVIPDDIMVTRNLITDNGGLITCSQHVLSLVNEAKHSLVMAHYVAKTMI